MNRFLMKESDFGSSVVQEVARLTRPDRCDVANALNYNSKNQRRGRPRSLGQPFLGRDFHLQEA